MSIIRSYLLKKYPNAIETFGFVTAENRNHLNLEKDHYIDACVIASGGLKFEELDVIYRKRRVSVQDRALTKGIRGEKKIHQQVRFTDSKDMIKLSIWEKFVL